MKRTRRQYLPVMAVYCLSCFYLSAFSQEVKNLQSLTPSSLLQVGKIEFKTFNNLYSQRSQFDGSGNRINSNLRSTFLASVNSVLYGKSPRLNYGLEFWVRSRKDGPRDSSPFSILSFDSGPDSRTELAYIGPKVKFTPIAEKENFSIQSTFLFPFGLDLDGSDNEDRIYVDDDRLLWINQFFLDNKLSDKFRLFLEVSTWISLDREGDTNRNKFELPVKGFFSYFPNDKWTFYYVQELWPLINGNFINTYFVASGIGMKYQLISGLLEVETLYTKFLIGRNTGAGSTYNLGVRLYKPVKQNSK